MAQLIVFIALCSGLLLAYFRPRIALFAAVFFIPWAGLDVDVGLRVTSYLVFMAPLFVVMLFTIMRQHRIPRIPGSKILWLVVIYAVLWTLLQVLLLDGASVSGGELRQAGARGFAQILMFLIMISPVWIVPILVKQRTDIIRLGQIYMISTLCLASIGWFQILVWVATGVDPFPVGFFNQLIGGESSIRSGMFEFEGGQIYRMSSFGGEPKSLGVGLAVALLILQSGLKFSRFPIQWLWLFLFASMIATFSTMALLTWFGASAIQLLTAKNFSVGIPRIKQPRRAIKWLVILIGFLVIIGATGKSGMLIDLIEARTVSRVAGEDAGFLEDFNYAVLNFLADQPVWMLTGTGLGNLHIHADAYLPDYAVPYAGGTTFVAKSGALRWVSELGGLSFAVFLLWVLSSVGRSIKRARYTEQCGDVAGTLAKLSLPLICFWLVSGYVAAQFYVTLGVCMAIGKLVRKGKC